MKRSKRQDFFRSNGIEVIDWTDAELLRRFLTSFGKIKRRKYTGLSMKMQRQLAKAVKRARQAGIISFTSR